MSLYALRKLGLDQVWWLVSPQNPLKGQKDMAGLADRMAHAATLAAHPRLVVTGIEAELGTRYTADTLRALKRRFSGRSLRLVNGRGQSAPDSAPGKTGRVSFHTVPVAVFRRPAYPAGRGLGKAAQRFARNWRPPSQAAALTVLPRPAWIMLDNRLNYNSATKIRKDDPQWLRK